MIVSGYGLQVSVGETTRTAWVVTHVVSSLLFSAVFVLHLLIRVRPARA